MRRILEESGPRYLIVGCLNTVVGYAVFFACLRLHQPYLMALVWSYVIGGAHSYVWNRRWTFRSKQAIGPQLPRFIFITSVTYLLNAVLLRLLVEGGLPPTIAQVLCLFATTLSGYLGHKLWSFRS